MILAAHQPNFIPWLPFFDKMNKADIFVILINCQFEKNGFQNRTFVANSWWTNPVMKGMVPIKEKHYTTAQSLVNVNMAWINAIALTLGIDTGKVRFDTQITSTGTQRIIDLCKQYECDQYLTNPTAKEKYLDEEALNKAGVELMEHSFPHKMSIFEAFETMGIQKVQKILEREKTRA